MKRVLCLTQLGACCFLLACGGGDAKTGWGTKAFDAAPADVKALWQAGSDAAKTNGYVQAIVSLRALQGKSLSAEQKKAVDATVTSVMDTVTVKAGDGDPLAKAAFDELRKMSGR